MNTLASCVNKEVVNGYTECFRVTYRGLYSISRSRYYRPEQVQVINRYHFETRDDSGSNAIIYIIETSDGLKGTLIDTYSTQPDELVHKFMAEVEDITRSVAQHNQHEC